VHEVDAIVVAIATRQHGLVTRSQVLDAGGTGSLIARRRRAGHWNQVASGVFRVGGTPRTFQQRVMAVVLAAGPGAVASHRTAARLWQVVGPRAVPIEVTVPYRRNVRMRGVIVHRSTDLDRGEVQVVDGVPVTGLSRTVLDLGAVTPRDVARAVSRARREHDLEWDELLSTLVRHARRGRRGVGPLRKVVAAHYGDLATDSDTEDLAFRILTSSGLVPRPSIQVPVVCADGVVVTVDLGWPRWRALVELYGVDHLTNEPLQHLDVHRRNQIELAGYRLLVYTGRLLRRQPDQFVADARQLLRASGCPLPEL
jgi:hypothetical protein